METNDRCAAEKKIVEMPAEQVMKVLIFMAGMEAGAAEQDGECQQGR